MRVFPKKGLFFTSLSFLSISFTAAICCFFLSFRAEAVNFPAVTETPEQDTTKPVKTEFPDDAIFTRAEQPAEFPGGMDGWRTYLEEHLRYPKKARKRGTEGVVKVQMMVMKDGKVGANLKLLNDPGDGLGEEALRVIKEGPDWIAARQNGKSVTYRFIQTIAFQLQ